jgi:ParB/RepB/Spo0J family partition protein
MSEGTLQSIPVDQIVITGNPRTVFDQQAIDDLALNIKVNGLIQPITVRQAPNDGKYELVTGARRLRAVKRLKWTEIDAIVRPIEDTGLRTQRLGENLNRVDLHPIEEADQYEAMRKEQNFSPKQIGEACGQPVQRVIARLPLAQLGHSVRKFALSKESPLEIGHLQILSQVASDEIQAEMLRHILKPPYGNQMLPVVQAKQLLDRYQIPLSRAQFDTSDPKLVPAAGGCADCPYNTRNLPRDQYPKKDVCVNLACFRKKQRAFFDCAAKSGDYEVVTKTKGVFENYGSRSLAEHRSGLRDADTERYEHNRKSYREILKPHHDLAPPLLIAWNPHTHSTVFAYRDKDLQAAMRKIKPRAASGAGQRRLDSAADRATAAKREREGLVDNRMLAEIAASARVPAGAEKAVFSWVLQRLCWDCDDDEFEIVMRACGVEPPETNARSDVSEKMCAAFLAKASGAQVLRALAALAAIDSYNKCTNRFMHVGSNKPKEAAETVKLLSGIEAVSRRKAVSKQVLAEERAKETEQRKKSREQKKATSAKAAKKRSPGR